MERTRCRPPLRGHLAPDGREGVRLQLHHLESVRDGDLSEWLVVPLSLEMHEGPNGIHGLSRRGFYNRYKLDDNALIAGTLKLAAQQLLDPGKTGILEAIATKDRA